FQLRVRLEARALANFNECDRIPCPGKIQASVRVRRLNAPCLLQQSREDRMLAYPLEPVRRIAGVGFLPVNDSVPVTALRRGVRLRYLMRVIAAREVQIKPRQPAQGSARRSKQ